ncbi:hypothetical protein GCM10022226_46050 [Sphaerisporangium flaviroseum]|uniref:CBS domain-containing protein n=1 Tax=Sphaerisporangium flaviroseum TaxID=509199 RepID=A0ABP7IJY6_9ACTN
MSVETLVAEQIMSRIVVTVKPDESPLLAWELMRRAGVHHLPVVDDACRVLGIITREDLAASWSGGPEEQSHRQVRTLAGQHRLPRVSSDQFLPRVAAAMLDAGRDAVPVTSEDGRLIGLVTAQDVLKAVAGRVIRPEGPAEVRTGLFRLEPIPPSATLG